MIINYVIVIVQYNKFIIYDNVIGLYSAFKLVFY